MLWFKILGFNLINSNITLEGMSYKKVISSLDKQNGCQKYLLFYTNISQYNKHYNHYNYDRMNACVVESVIASDAERHYECTIAFIRAYIILYYITKTIIQIMRLILRDIQSCQLSVGASDVLSPSIH